MAVCSVCGQAFACEVQTISACWCRQYPPILEVTDANGTCMCQHCMHTAVVAKSIELAAAVVADEPNIVNQLGKPSQLIEGIDYYVEHGFFVFSKWYHLRKGYCCKNGCRHCPYGFGR